MHTRRYLSADRRHCKKDQVPDMHTRSCSDDVPSRSFGGRLMYLAQLVPQVW